MWPISAWRPVLGAILAARPGWATLGNWNPPSIRADLKPTPVYRLRSSYTAGLPHGIYASWEEEWEHPESYTHPASLQNIHREGVRL